MWNSSSTRNPALQKDGVEAHLQQLLADAPQALGEGFTLVRREHPTRVGPVDLLCTDAEGNSVAVEIKRHGEIDSVGAAQPLSGEHARRTPS